MNGSPLPPAAHKQEVGGGVLFARVEEHPLQIRFLPIIPIWKPSGTTRKTEESHQTRSHPDRKRNIGGDVQYLMITNGKQRHRVEPKRIKVVPFAPIRRFRPPIHWHHCIQRLRPNGILQETEIFHPIPSSRVLTTKISGGNVRRHQTTNGKPNLAAVLKKEAGLDVLIAMAKRLPLQIHLRHFTLDWQPNGIQRKMALPLPTRS